MTDSMDVSHALEHSNVLRVSVFGAAVHTPLYLSRERWLALTGRADIAERTRYARQGGPACASVKHARARAASGGNDASARCKPEADAGGTPAQHRQRPCRTDRH